MVIREIVGYISAQRGLPNRIKHTAYIVVGIRNGFQGKGIGELTVMCPNVMAKHLYENNGFVVEGIKKNAMLVDGKYVDEYYMAKLLE